ncbi:MAG: hypothetical protein L0226_02545 [Acidobacteria bacterium]|nr:hypothetical protein [Acidobacteriota bacterium]
MNNRQWGQWLKFGALVILLAGAVALYQRAQAQQQPEISTPAVAQAQKVELPRHAPATDDGKNMVVQLCDGETNVTVQGVRPGERLSAKQAQAVSDHWIVRSSMAIKFSTTTS